MKRLRCGTSSYLTYLDFRMKEDTIFLLHKMKKKKRGAVRVVGADHGGLQEPSTAELLLAGARHDALRQFTAPFPDFTTFLFSFIALHWATQARVRARVLFNRGTYDAVFTAPSREQEKASF